MVKRPLRSVNLNWLWLFKPRSEVLAQSIRLGAPLLCDAVAEIAATPVSPPGDFGAFIVDGMAIPYRRGGPATQDDSTSVPDALPTGRSGLWLSIVPEGYLQPAKILWRI
jgi:hypothetical protein